MKKITLLLIIISTYSYHIFAQCASNGNFETWELDTIVNQSNDTILYPFPERAFSFIDGFGLEFSTGSNPDFALNQTTDAQSGNFAVRIDASPDNDGDMFLQLACAGHPKMLHGYYKYNGALNDTAAIAIIGGNDDLSAVDSTSASVYGELLIKEVSSVYKSFSIKLKYNDPSAVNDTFLVIFALNNRSSSDRSFWIDNITLSDDPVGIQQYTENEMLIYPNPVLKGRSLQISFPKAIRTNTVTIWDIAGKEVFSQQYQNVNSANLATENFKEGIYFLRINGINNRKIIIQ